MNDETLRRLQEESQRQLTEAARRRLQWLSAFHSVVDPAKAFELALTAEDRAWLKANGFAL